LTVIKPYFVGDSNQSGADAAVAKWRGIVKVKGVSSMSDNNF